MHHIVTAEEMRRLDAVTIDEIGLPGAVLMENAGRAVTTRVLEILASEARPARAPDITPGVTPHVAVVCGAGNNGGDGYVIARCLRQHGVDAVVYLASGADKLAGDARLHFEAYRKLGGPVVPIDDSAGLAGHAAAIHQADLVIDAVFGTGLAREVTGHHRAVIETINKSRGVVVAVDIPSGLSADTGQTLGISVDADHTVTMAFLKVGIASAPGFTRAGQVRIAEIGIPTSLGADHGVSIHMLERADYAALIDPPSPLDHKNRRGHVLAVAGSPGKRGAARLLAWAALRGGAGLVTVAAPWHGGELVMPDPVMTALLDPDAQTLRKEGTPERPHDTAGEGAALARLIELAAGKRVVAMGPGMPVTPGGRALVHGALAELAVPLVLDADALNHLVGSVDAVAQAQAPVILTPHPGEAARLLGTSAGEIEGDRVAAVRRLAGMTGAVVVLKGARSLICDGRSERLIVAINPSGGPALATAGSGDVLTGVLAALVARGLDAFDAARLGVYLHGRCGDLAAEAIGPLSVTAADLADMLPEALAELL